MSGRDAEVVGTPMPMLGFVLTLTFMFMLLGDALPTTTGMLLAVVVGNFDRLGMLAADVKMLLVLSRMTPASTRNSLADGSRFSRLDE